MIFRTIPFTGGQPFDARTWNKNLMILEDILNDIHGSRFRPQSITEDRFVEAILQRSEVSEQGGANKVIELDEFGDIAFTSIGPNDNNKVFMDATNFMEADYADKEHRFFIGGTERATIDINGWV